MKGTQPVAPPGLSEWAASVWAELTQVHTFDGHELVVFERSLRWWDTSDAAATQAKTATGPELVRLTKLSLDASTAALRHWRALKFPAPNGVRRPGRPSGVDWSAKRKVLSA